MGESLGARMRRIMMTNRAPRLPVDKPIVALIDGVNFSKYSRFLSHPYDERLDRLMLACAVDTLQHTRANCMFVWGDKACITWSADRVPSGYCDDCNNRVVSLLAAGMTANFLTRLSEFGLSPLAEQRPLFSAQIWPVPSHIEGANTMLYFWQTSRNRAISSFMLAAGEDSSTPAQRIAAEGRVLSQLAAWPQSCVYGTFLWPGKPPGSAVKAASIGNAYSSKNKVNFIYNSDQPAYADNAPLATYKD